MSEINCNACAELRETSPEFVTNGTTETVCTSLQNDTGFNPSLTVLHDDAEDLHDANDCLIGMEITEVESYEVCDWKKFMKNHLKNLYELLKAIICSLKGIWTYIHKHDCQIATLYNGVNFSIGETTEGDAYVVAGKGVSFLAADGSQPNVSDVGLRLIAGGFVRGGGSFIFHVNDFTENVEVGNFDLGTAYRRSTARLGNSAWNSPIVAGGELICEIRIKKSAFPQIDNFASGIGQESGGGSYHVGVWEHHVGGHYAPGQHGGCNPTTGVAYQPGFDDGHVVPNGWIYIQVRMTSTSIFNVGDDGHQYSPVWIMGLRTKRDKAEC